MEQQLPIEFLVAVFVVFHYSTYHSLSLVVVMAFEVYVVVLELELSVSEFVFELLLLLLLLMVVVLVFEQLESKLELLFVLLDFERPER